MELPGRDRHESNHFLGGSKVDSSFYTMTQPNYASRVEEAQSPEYPIWTTAAHESPPLVSPGGERHPLDAHRDRPEGDAKSSTLWSLTPNLVR